MMTSDGSQNDEIKMILKFKLVSLHIMEFGPRFGTTFDPYCSPMQQVQHGHYLKCL